MQTEVLTSDALPTKAGYYWCEDEFGDERELEWMPNFHGGPVKGWFLDGDHRIIKVLKWQPNDRKTPEPNY